MKATAAALLMLVRFSGHVTFVLGVLFWTHRASGLIPWHIRLGFVLVVALWLLAALAARAGARPAAVAGALLLGLLLPVVGIAQLRVLQGSNHWIIQVVHLLLGLLAIGAAESLSAVFKRTVA